MTIEQICIRGDKTNGKRIIQFFERLGYKNDLDLNGTHDYQFYYVSEGGIRSKGVSLLQSKLTVITLSDTLLPSEWCVEMPCEEALKYVIAKSGSKFSGVCKYYGYDEHEGYKGRSDQWGLTLTPSQFKALTEDQREIEYYECPVEAGQYIQKGSRFIKKDEHSYINEHGNLMYKAIVEAFFTPVFKEEKIMVDGKEVEFKYGDVVLAGVKFSPNEVAAIHRIISSNTTPETIEKIINKLK